MCDEVDRAFSKFSSYGSRARCEGSGDDKRILVSFFAQADLSSVTSGPCADLLDLIFVQYFPADMKRNVEAKSLFVTDISLFLTETQVHSAFSHYGSVVCCKFSLKKHYYTADDMWAILCLGNSLRVCPAHYSKTQRDARRQYVAVIASIPKNIKEADLTDIANQVSAKAINIPLSFTSYKLKPYVYMNFFSQETFDAAKELTVSFRNRESTYWLSNCYLSSSPNRAYHYPLIGFLLNLRVMTHEYQIVEVKNTVYPDANPQSSYENFDTYQDNQEMRQEPEELYNWDDVDRVPMNTHKLPPSRSLIMQISPDTSFSQDGPANVLSSQHVPFPTSEVLQPRRPQTVSQPIDFHKELNSLTSTQELIHGQLGSILTKLDARSSDYSVLLGGDLNADLEFFLKQLTAAHPAHFDFLELRDHHAPSYMKQRQRCRTSYDFHSASPVQKESFTSAISTMLPDASLLSRTTSLNQLWHQFKSALLSASRLHFPRINISLSRPKDIPHELQPYTRLNNSLTHFMISLQKLVTISQLQLAWSRFFVDFKPAFLSLFPDQLCLLDNLPDPLNLEYIFTVLTLSFNDFWTQFRKSLRKLKQFLSTRITLEFEKFKTVSMKSAIAERNINFYENKGKFISSSLNRERRCIVLDCVLVVDLPDCPKLLVAPEEIKAAAITHFQNVVGPSVSPFDSLSTLPPRWKKRYAPLAQFQESLYDPVMTHISVSELHSVISLSPTHKAPGPSSIPYEWFK
ncbi:hypothetical protein RhiirA4_428511, partial [Rhizophagus irregularis]